MPYNIWCGGCGNHIGMGVRYNAEKKKVGNYYTTPIYRFRMKCHLCDNHFEIETDPKNCDYVIVSGARRKEERWEPSATETVELTDREDAKKLTTDPMYKLEHGVKDEQKSKAAQPTLGQLQEVQSVWKDDYAANQLLRKIFREKKHELKAQETKDTELKEKAALDISLVPERLEDIELAKKIRYHGEGFDEHRRKRRFEVSSRPMFDSKGKLDEKREKVKQLLGKRKQMQLNSFSSPPKSSNELVNLGVKVRRNKSTNSDGSAKCSDKESTVEDSTIEDPETRGGNAATDGNLNRTLSTSRLRALAHSALGTSTAEALDVLMTTGPEVTSQCDSCNRNEDPASFSSKKEDHGNEINDCCLSKQPKDMPNTSLISSAMENRKTDEQNGCSEAKSDVLRVSSSSVGSLVCCDYTDSSDASDDTT